IPGWSGISKDLEVIATNLLLALLALLIILVATNMFNETLAANGPEINLLLNKFTGASASLAAFMGWLSDADAEHPTVRRSFLLSLIKPTLLIVLTAGIYTLMEPDFGWNQKSLVLGTALIIGIALATFLFEGGQVWWATHHYSTPAALRIFPLAILIAVASVLLT